MTDRGRFAARGAREKPAEPGTARGVEPVRSGLSPTVAIVSDAPDVRPFAEIARGPVATVYKAFDRASGSVVLLKRLHAVDPERRRRFADEARLAAGVAHPNVVRVLHAGDDELVAEWVEGEDLAGVVARCGALPAGLAAYVAREAARGLGAVHGAGVVHRDVSARNVMVGTDGAVKLTDFGLASLADARDDEVRGTLGTLAPEVVRGEPADARSDLFSLGAVLAHALTGRPPFAGDGASDTLDAVLHGDPAAALDADPRVPPALAATAAALLAKDPASRPASAAAAADRLADALDALGAPGADDLAAFLDDPAGYEPPPVPAPAPASVAAPAPPRPAARPGAWRARRWPAAAGLAAVLAVVALAVALTGPDDETPAARAEEPTPVPVEIATGPEPTFTPDAEAPPVLDDPISTPPATPPPATPRDRAEPAGEADAPPARPEPADRAPASTPPAARAEDDPPAPSPVQTGTLTVSAQPWARVRVGDRDLGTTPVSAVALPAGEHAVTLTNPDFPAHTVRVRVAAGEQTDAVVSLWSLVSRIDVEVVPWADVVVDGEPWDTVPPQERPLVLAPGDHVLGFAHPTLGTREVRLRVAAGERRTVRVRMGED